MFDGIVRKITDKMGRSVKETIEPIKKEVQKVANNKVDLYSKILKLGVLIFLFIEGTKKVTNMNEPQQTPSQIIINNYISRKEDA